MMYKNLAFTTPSASKRRRVEDTPLDATYSVPEFNIRDPDPFFGKGISVLLENSKKIADSKWEIWFYDPNILSHITKENIYLKVSMVYSSQYDSEVLTQLDRLSESRLKIDFTKGHFYFKIEECLTPEDHPETNTLILQFRISNHTISDRTVCELQHLLKGDQLTGSQGLDYMNFFKGVLGVAHTVLSDASMQKKGLRFKLGDWRSEPKEDSYSLKLYHTLLRGESWYESIGYRAFPCLDVKDHIGTPTIQHPLLYRLAIAKIQSTSLVFLWASQAPKHKERFFEMILKYIPDFDSESPTTVRDLLHQIDIKRRLNPFQTWGDASLLFKRLSLPETKKSPQNIQLHNRAFDALFCTTLFISQHPIPEHPAIVESFDVRVIRLGIKTSKEVLVHYPTLIQAIMGDC